MGGANAGLLMVHRELKWDFCKMMIRSQMEGPAEYRQPLKGGAPPHIGCYCVHLALSCLSTARVWFLIPFPRPAGSIWGQHGDRQQMGPSIWLFFFLSNARLFPFRFGWWILLSITETHIRKTNSITLSWQIMMISVDLVSLIFFIMIILISLIIFNVIYYFSSFSFVIFLSGPRKCFFFSYFIL